MTGSAERPGHLCGPFEFQPMALPIIDAQGVRLEPVTSSYGQSRSTVQASAHQHDRTLHTCSLGRIDLDSCSSEILYGTCLREVARRHVFHADEGAAQTRQVFAEEPYRLFVLAHPGPHMSAGYSATQRIFACSSATQGDIAQGAAAHCDHANGTAAQGHETDGAAADCHDPHCSSADRDSTYRQAAETDKAKRHWPHGQHTQTDRTRGVIQRQLENFRFRDMALQDGHQGFAECRGQGQNRQKYQTISKNRLLKGGWIEANARLAETGRRVVVIWQAVV